MTPFEALDLSRAEFERRLRDIGAADWGLPTPCADWSVWELVNHVVGGARRYTMLLHGADTAVVDATRALDHISPEPLKAFRSVSEDMVAAFHEPNALQRTVQHRAGARSGRELLEMRVLEFTVHGWDLARAIDVDAAMSPQLIEVVLRRLDSSHPDRAGHDSFDRPRGDLPVGASRQARLLHLTGRDPRSK